MFGSDSLQVANSLSEGGVTSCVYNDDDPKGSRGVRDRRRKSFKKCVVLR